MATQFPSKNSRDWDEPLKAYIDEKAALSAPEHRGLRAMADQLKGGRGGAVLNISDSTANAADEWYGRLAKIVAQRFPALTVETRLLTEATDKFAPASVVQTGTAGPHSVTMGSTGSGPAYYLDNSEFSGHDVDIAVKVQSSAWETDATRTLVAQMENPGARGMQFLLMGASNLYRPRLTLYPDGTTASSMTATVTPTYVNGQALWLRVTFDADDGAGNRVAKFYTGAETPTGITWTQLGATVTTAGVTPTFRPPNINYQVGASNGGSVFAGATFYDVQIRDGIDGALLNDPVVARWLQLVNAGATINGAPVFTFWNAAVPGKNLAYFADPARFPKVVLPHSNISAVFINDGHNESARTGRKWLGDMGSFLSAVAARVPQAPLNINIQNPQTAPANNPALQNQRMRELLLFARSTRHGVIDVFSPMNAYAGAMTDLVSSADGIHPTVGTGTRGDGSGSDLWAEVAWSALEPLLA